ncbi:MAG: GIY-YIG nuclease family protein [Proteobacteria bacterium]|nr:GIY-YIG nuclease family protein [Pseudomonadota bacterium]
MISRLKKVGFRRVGRWVMGEERPEYELDAEKMTYNVLYSFVSGTEILYIGKTTIPLKQRMYQYQRPGPSQRTNIRVNAEISELLNKGSKVDILALPDPGDMEYKGFHLNLAAGLEDSLIAELKPKWNKTGK